MMNFFVKRNAWLFFFLAVAAHAQSNSSNTSSSSSNNTNSSSQPDDDNDGGNNSSWIVPPDYQQPPWGFSSYGNVDNYGSSYIKAAGFVLDVVRPGWSWNSNRQEQIIAPFCFDTIPGYASTCFTGQVKDNCQTSGLQGTPAYGDLFCLSHQPHTIVGPVCWNRTCYGAETQQACAAVEGGWFVGGKSFNTATPDGVTIEAPDVGWCVVPGSDHTVFGPACYGEECFTDDLVEACQKLNGTNFADRFCLLDRSHTVVGPICTPNTTGPIEAPSDCYPEETTQLCAEMGGTSVGGIFCILKGSEYSVLGPFCFSWIYDQEPESIYPGCVSVEDGESACQALSGRSIGNGTFCILDGSDYHLLGPLCVFAGAGTPIGCSNFGGENYCLSKFGGQSVGEYSCILKGDYTIVGPSTYNDIVFSGDNILANGVDENTVHSVLEGTRDWFVLNGTYNVYGPTCYKSFCYDGDCIGAGGSRINSLFCVMKIGATGSSSSGGGSFSFLSHIMAAALAGCLFLFLQY